MIQVTATPGPMWRIAMVLLAVAGAVIAKGVYDASPAGLKHFLPGALAVIALAMGLGRFVYTIRANAHVRFRLVLFGIPVLSQVVRASSFHSMEMEEQRDGSVTLRFRDPSGHPRLTIDGFSTREQAERIGGLFRIDGERQSAAIRGFVEEAVAEERWFSRGAAALLVAAVFCVMPGLARMMGYPLDEAGYPMTAGAFLTLCTAFAVRRESGLIAIADDRSHIDRWTRHGWFRILEYRQHLGEAAGQSPLRLRWDRGLWLMPLLVLAQVACVFLVCRQNTRQAAARAVPYHATPEFRDSEAVRQGAERFQQFRERREKRK